MTRPQELVEGVLYTLQKSDKLPDKMSFIGYEPDIESEPIKLPIIEVDMGTQVSIDEVNTDFVGFEEDESGNDVGRIYQTLYTQELRVSVWTAQDSRYDPRDISDDVRTELYSHVTSGPGKPLRHPDDDRILGDTFRIWMTEGEHTDDLSTSPSLRRWEITMFISASEEFIVQPDAGVIESFDQATSLNDVLDDERISIQ